MFNARTAMQDRLSEIREEVRSLSDERIDIMQQLRMMDDQDGERVDLVALSAELSDAIMKLKEVVPNVSVKEVIEHLVKQVPEAPQMVAAGVGTKIPETQLFKQEVRAAADQEAAKQKPLSREHRRTTIPRAGAARTRVVGKLVKNMLVSAAEPVKIADLRMKLEEDHGVEYNPSTFSAVMKNLSASDPTIEKVSFGTYHIKPEEPVLAASHAAAEIQEITE